MANIAHVSIAVPPPPVDTTFSPVHSSPTDSDSSCSTCSTRASSSSDDSVEPSSCYPYTPSPSSSSSSSATRPAAPSSSSSSAFTFSLPIRSSSPSPSNATSAYIRSFVCLVLVGVCSSSLYALSIRLSCDPFARLPPWPQPGLLFAGHFPYLRFAINLLWYCTPRTHAIAAFVMLWAFTLPGDDGPLGGTIRDYSRLSGWNGLLQELMGDAASTRRAVSAYFTLPEADTISSLRAPLMSAVEMENGVLASAPQRAASSLCSSSSSSSSSTCLFLVRRLLCCPFALLRLYFSPRTALGVLYRLALYNVLVAGLDDMGYELMYTFGIIDYGLPADTFVNALYGVGLSKAWVDALQHSRYAFNRVLYSHGVRLFTPLLLLATFSRPSQHRSTHKPDSGREQQAPAPESSNTSTSDGSTITGRRNNAFSVYAADGTSEHEAQSQHGQQQEPDPTPSTSTSSSVIECHPTIVIAVSPSSSRCGRLRCWSAGSGGSGDSTSTSSSSWSWPTLLWLWPLVFLVFYHLEIVMFLWVKYDRWLDASYQYFLLVDSNCLMVFFVTLLGVLLLEQSTHCRSAHHVRHAGHSRSRSDSQAASTCSCRWWRVLLVACCVSLGFALVAEELRQQYGRLEGESVLTNSIGLTLEKAVKFYLLMALWKACTMWGALYCSLPPGTSEALLFPISLLEDVWSFFFLTSFTPLSVLFWLLCVGLFVKTLIRDLDAPLVLFTVLTQRAMRLTGRVPATPRTISHMLPAGWRGPYERRVLRDQYFVSFIVAKVVVAGALLVDTLPAAIGSYTVSPLLTPGERLGRLFSLAWLVLQQCITHAAVAWALDKLDGDGMHHSADGQRHTHHSHGLQQHKAKQQQQQHKATHQEVLEMRLMEDGQAITDKADSAALADEDDREGDGHAADGGEQSANQQRDNPNSPSTPPSSVASAATSSSEASVCHWSRHYLFFALCVLTVSLDILSPGVVLNKHYKLRDIRCLAAM